MLKYLSCLLFACLACTPPQAPEETQPKLTMLAVSEDTLFAGEQFTIAVDKVNIDPQELKLFVHTDAMQIDSVVDSTIYVTVLVGEPGRLRLYWNEREAEGNFNLYLYGQTQSDFFRSAITIAPNEGREGDTIMVYFRSELPNLDSLDLRINDLPLVYLEQDRNGYHLYRIPEGVTDGWLWVTIAGERGKYFHFDARYDDEPFLERGTVRDVAVSVQFPYVMTSFDSNGVVTSNEGENLGLRVIMSQGTQIIVNPADSFRVVYDYVNGDTIRRIRMVLHHDSITRLVSGSITLVWATEIEVDGRIKTLHIDFKDMSWRRKFSSNTMECKGADIGKSLVFLSYRTEHRVTKTVSQLVQYTFDGPNPALHISILN